MWGGDVEISLPSIGAWGSWVVGGLGISTASVCWNHGTPWDWPVMLAFGGEHWPVMHHDAGIGRWRGWHVSPTRILRWLRHLQLCVGSKKSSAKVWFDVLLCSVGRGGPPMMLAG